VGDFLESILEPGETLVAAVSGGVDSMVLLDILDGLRSQLALKLHVAHLDHQLRLESAEDCDFVAAVAAQRGLSCTCGREDVAAYAKNKRLSLEDAARRLRYRFLDQVAQDVGSKKIALGHHADDQAETVLLRLLRGSGSTGLSGMAAVRQERYIRPLLPWRRSTIEDYARAIDLNFREDASNRDLRFGRNRMRHELIPLLERSYNPAIVEVLKRTAAVLRDEDGLLGKMAQDAVETVVKEWCETKITLDSRQLLGYHIAIQRRVVRQLLQGLSAREGPFDFAQTEALLGLADKRCSGVCEFADIRAQNVGEELIFCRGSHPAVNIDVQVPGQTCVTSHRCSVDMRLVARSEFAALKSTLGGRRAAFDARLADQRLRLRSLQVGDRFQPLGMTGHKKLSDLLIDCKWPRILRDEILLLTCADEIVWVAGLRSSQLFRVREDTREILLVEMRPNL
jgi:tRNA(Ile)-lysidine synthase